MATRLELRTMVRTRLAELTPGLWTDAAINQAMGSAHVYLGQQFPGETISTVAVATSATTVTAPAAVREVLAVVDALGTPIERADSWPIPPAIGIGANLWCWWAGLIRLARPVAGAEAGNWQVYSTVRRLAFPGNDIDTVDIDVEIEQALVSRAAAESLRTLEHDELRRRHMTTAAARALILDLEEACELVIRTRRRAARGVITW